MIAPVRESRQICAGTFHHGSAKTDGDRYFLGLAAVAQLGAHVPTRRTAAHFRLIWEGTRIS